MGGIYMDTDKPVFPESDAWADSMAEMSHDFAASAQRKTATGAAGTAVDREFKTFSTVDLTNLGKMGR